MSIGDSNVVDGADVNPPSADAGPDPCVSNHDVLPLVPVVPDVPVSTEAMMPRTARRGIVEIPLCGLNHWSWIRSIYVLPAIEGEHEAKYGISPVFNHQHTGHHGRSYSPAYRSHAGHVHVHHAENVTGVVTGVLVNVTGVVTGVL